MNSQVNPINLSQLTESRGSMIRLPATYKGLDLTGGQSADTLNTTRVKSVVLSFLVILFLATLTPTAQSTEAYVISLSEESFLILHVQCRLELSEMSPKASSVSPCKIMFFIV